MVSSYVTVTVFRAARPKSPRPEPKPGQGKGGVEGGRAGNNKKAQLTRDRHWHWLEETLMLYCPQLVTCSRQGTSQGTHSRLMVIVRNGDDGGWVHGPYW